MFAGEIPYKLKAAVRDYDVQGAMVLPDLTKEKASCSNCCDSCVHCDKVCMLCDAIDNVHNSVVAVGTR
jgi:hypothetical protein